MINKDAGIQIGKLLGMNIKLKGAKQHASAGSFFGFLLKNLGPKSDLGGWAKTAAKIQPTAGSSAANPKGNPAKAQSTIQMGGATLELEQQETLQFAPAKELAAFRAEIRKVSGQAGLKPLADEISQLPDDKLAMVWLSMKAIQSVVQAYSEAGQSADAEHTIVQFVAKNGQIEQLAIAENGEGKISIKGSAELTSLLGKALPLFKKIDNSLAKAEISLTGQAVVDTAQTAAGEKAVSLETKSENGGAIAGKTTVSSQPESAQAAKAAKADVSKFNRAGKQNEVFVQGQKNANHAGGSDLSSQVKNGAPEVSVDGVKEKVLSKQAATNGGADAKNNTVKGHAVETVATETKLQVKEGSEAVLKALQENSPQLARSLEALTKEPGDALQKISKEVFSSEKNGVTVSLEKGRFIIKTGQPLTKSTVSKIAGEIAANLPEDMAPVKIETRQEMAIQNGIKNGIEAASKNQNTAEFYKVAENVIAQERPALLTALKTFTADPDKNSPKLLWQSKNKAFSLVADKGNLIVHGKEPLADPNIQKIAGLIRNLAPAALKEKSMEVRSDFSQALAIKETVAGSASRQNPSVTAEQPAASEVIKQAPAREAALRTETIAQQPQHERVPVTPERTRIPLKQKVHILSFDIETPAVEKIKPQVTEKSASLPAAGEKAAAAKSTENNIMVRLNSERIVITRPAESPSAVPNTASAQKESVSVENGGKLNSQVAASNTDKPLQNEEQGKQFMNQNSSDEKGNRAFSDNAAPEKRIAGKTIKEVFTLNQTQAQPAVKEGLPLGRMQMAQTVQKLVEVIETYNAQRRNLVQEARLHVETDTLGDMEVRVRNGRQATLVMLVENDAAKQEVARMLPQLSESLAGKGLTFSSIQVDVGQSQERDKNKASGRSTGKNRVEQTEEEGHDVKQQQPGQKRYGYNTMEVIA